MKIFAETERLILREILPTDVDGLFELDSDPEVHRYLGNNPVTGKDQIVAVIGLIRQQYIDHGIGRWAILDKRSNEFIGWAGLKWVTEVTNGYKDYYDLGYRLIRKYWGRGIATEAAFAALAYAFNDLNAQEVYATADVGNIGSNKILQKTGLSLLDTFEDEGSMLHWYRISRAEFEK
jgi:ribosomal-protein-alanine N-acetyltransferase